MRINTSLYLHGFILLAITSYLFVVTAKLHASNTVLIKTYKQIKTKLDHNVYGIPVYIQSTSDNHTMHGQVYGILNHPFQTIRQALEAPGNWCDIVPQHLNVKACTLHNINGKCGLTVYTGRKHYEAPADVYQIPYQFKNIDVQQNYFQANLTSEKGPMGTKNYHIEVEAIPLDRANTFIRFSYSYNYNFLTTIGMKSYLATIGKGKIGFSVIGTDEQDVPIYISGVRGIIERNSIRYFFAIQSYLDSLGAGNTDRFLVRINKWFDLTEKYKAQLFEMERKDYIKYKQLERKDQILLQQQIDINIPTNKGCKTQQNLNL